MKFYQVVSEYFEEGGATAHHKFFGSLREAKTVAQTAANETGFSVEAFRIGIADDKASIIAFLNSDASYKTREHVFTAEPKSID